MSAFHSLLLRLYDVAISAVTLGVLIPYELAAAALNRTLTPLNERRGRVRPDLARRRRLVVHAVSVGEMAVASALLEAFAAEDTDLTVVLTTGNRDGRAAGEQLAERFTMVERVCYLPWDRRSALRHWLMQLRPEALIVIETELWPALLTAAKQLGTPVLIVNGRVYPNDRARYRRTRFFFAPVLDCVAWFGVLSSDEQQAFADLGAPPDRIEVVGNLKYDVPRPVSDRLAEWAVASEGPLLVAGSTHPGEEAPLLAVYHHLLETIGPLRLVIAPRHPHRARKVRRLARRQQLLACCLSEDPAPDWDVLVVDRLGWLSTVYAHADVAILGGSFVPAGGHNPIEAAAHGAPVVIGPHTANVADLVARLEDAGALRVLRSSDPFAELADVLRQLLTEPHRRAAMAERGRMSCASARGVARHTVRTILDRVSPAASP